LSNGAHALRVTVRQAHLGRRRDHEISNIAHRMSTPTAAPYRALELIEREGQ
jgi:hypothetical protein